jgi:hypothetical protein
LKPRLVLGLDGAGILSFSSAVDNVDNDELGFTPISSVANIPWEYASGYEKRSN